MDELPEDVMVSASWYGFRDSTRCLLEFDATVDRTLYSLEHFIGSPCLEYNTRSKLFHLANPSETLQPLMQHCLRRHQQSRDQSVCVARRRKH